MERDFMGLAVKQEISDEIIDAAPVRSLPMQWSFSNNGSSVPQLLSFQGVQEDKPNSGFASLASLAPESLNSDHKTYASAQKNMFPEKQGGVRYATTMTTYPMKTHQMITSLTMSPAVATSVHQPFIANGPVVGTTDLRNSSKISNSPAQLTIFYNGSVCVYDNISPEKAQAIMLLAGNGAQTPAIAPVQASIPKTVVVSQSAAAPMKPVGVVASSSIIAAEPLKVVHPVPSSVPANLFSSGTVPQFRRKSLARFLEKRKERVVSGSPYGETASGACPVSATN